MAMNFEKVELKNVADIAALSALATDIVREHFDPLIGKAQNDYMLSRFQTIEAITDQLEHGYQYYFVCEENQRIGFLAFYPRGEVLYLSKFYLQKAQRGKGYSKLMLQFVIEHAKQYGLDRIVLNVNRDNSAVHAYEHLGFVKIREEKNDIGHGFFMDDFVFAYNIPQSGRNIDAP